MCKWLHSCQYFASKRKIKSSHLLDIPGSCSTSKHSRDAGSDGFLSLLGTDEVDMGIETTRSNNAMFACNHICAVSDHEVGIYAIHHVRVSSLAHARDYAVFDTNIGLVYPCPVDYQGIRNYSIQTFVVGPSACLTHAFSQSLAAPKRAFITVPRHIFFDLDPQVCGSQSYQVTRCGSEHANVGLSLHGADINMRRISRWFRFVQETPGLDVLHNVISHVSNEARSNLISTLDDLVSCNLDQCDRFGVAGLETNRSASGDVQPVAMRSDAIELKLRVRFNEVVV